jgi:hypothetical protein
MHDQSQMVGELLHNYTDYFGIYSQLLEALAVKLIQY